MTPLLQIADLRVTFPMSGGIFPVDGVSFSISRGETLALVGESGCGKSLTGLALLGLIPAPGRIAGGSSVRLDGAELVGLTEPELRRIRGRRIGMVFQDPMTSLNPVLTVERQITEAITAHESIRRTEARQRALDLLVDVGIPAPESRLGSYPHQLSGGMRQRVMIAIALAANPDVLVADEPTTALDVTVQAQLLELLDHLKAARGMAMLLITHDLGIVAGRADRACVMYAGQIVEEASTPDLFASPSHPYTRGLFGSIPHLEGPRVRLSPIPGSVPSPDQWPGGCRFNPRCPIVFDRCLSEAPGAIMVSGSHGARCWLAGPER